MSGIKPYGKLEKQLHGDIQKLITTGRYKSLNADSVLKVFGRVYSVYALSHLIEIGFIKINKKVKSFGELK